MPPSTDPRYPIGPLTMPGTLTPQARAAAIATIAAVPERLSAVVRGLDQQQLDTPYRDGGWTVRQVVHHLADSHVNAYVRCKLVVTEAEPPVKGYAQAEWAQLPDANGPIGPSLLILSAVHERWVHCLRSLPPEAFARVCVHSERGRMTLDDLVATYAWHGPHHVAHISGLRTARIW